MRIRGIRRNVKPIALSTPVKKVGPKAERPKGKKHKKEKKGEKPKKKEPVSDGTSRYFDFTA